jgi:hypothetical protein
MAYSWFTCSFLVYLPTPAPRDGALVCRCIILTASRVLQFSLAMPSSPDVAFTCRCSVFDGFLGILAIFLYICVSQLLAMLRLFAVLAFVWLCPIFDVFRVYCSFLVYEMKGPCHPEILNESSWSAMGPQLSLSAKESRRALSRRKH